MEFMQLKHLATDLTLHERGGVMYSLNRDDKVSKSPWTLFGGSCIAKAVHRGLLVFSAISDGTKS